MRMQSGEAAGEARINDEHVNLRALVARREGLVRETSVHTFVPGQQYTKSIGKHELWMYDADCQHDEMLLTTDHACPPLSRSECAALHVP